MKKLIIKKLYKSYSDDNPSKVYLNAILSNEETEDHLWYEFDKEYEDFLCDDRIDGIVVNLLVTAMRIGYDVIESTYPISEELYYNLTYHVLPQYFSLNDKNCSNIVISAPTTKETFEPKGVATGLSRGVDSFATMYEYGEKFPFEEYRLTHYTYFNAGAHHGYDTFVGKSQYTNRELYDRQLDKTLEFCEKYNLNLIIVNSNLASVLGSRKLFRPWSFDRTHTMRNLGIIMLLQKGIKRYYYSSAYNLDQFEFIVNTDMAKYEKWLIPYIRTENMEFFNSNQGWTRMEKVENITSLEESYDYLTVCLVDDKNCGKCRKCKRTLLELDALGDEVLGRYAKSFDLDTYRKEDRHRWFSEIWTAKEAKDDEGGWARESFTQALKTHPELIQVPLTYDTEKEHHQILIARGVVNLREYPALESNVIKQANLGDAFQYLGEFNNWYKVKIDDQTEGYVTKDYTVAVDGAVSFREELKDAAIITKQAANVRSLPTIQSKPLGKTEKGELFTYLGEVNGWFKLRMQNGQEGFIYKPLVTLFANTTKNAAVNENTPILAKTDVSNLYDAPASSATVISEVALYERLTYIGEEGYWCKVALKNGVVGFIHKALITIIDTTVKTRSNAQYTGIVIKEKLTRIRSLPTTHSESVCTVKKYQQFKYLGDCGNWYKVGLTDGQEGYIHKPLAVLTNFKETKVFDAEHTVALIHSPGVRIRQSPSTDSAILSVASQGTSYPCLAQCNVWYKVQLNENEVGYVYGRYVEVIDCAAIVNPDLENHTVFITHKDLDVAAYPSQYATVIGQVKRGQKFNYLGECGGWLKIAYDENTIGFVKKENTLLRPYRLPDNDERIVLLSSDIQLSSYPSKLANTVPVTEDHRFFKVFAHYGDWIEVRYKKKYRYVQASDVKKISKLQAKLLQMKK